MGQRSDPTCDLSKTHIVASLSSHLLTGDHAASCKQPRASQSEDPWGSVRLLPRIVFGAHPSGDDGLVPTDPNVAVLHHRFTGSSSSGSGSSGDPDAARAQPAAAGGGRSWSQRLWAVALGGEVSR